MTTYERHYQQGSADNYDAQGTVIQMNYTVVNTDNTSVMGQLTVPTGLLNDDQIDELCAALTVAGSAVTWTTFVTISAAEDGRRSFTVTPVEPPTP